MSYYAIVKFGASIMATMQWCHPISFSVIDAFLSHFRTVMVGCLGLVEWYHVYQDRHTAPYNLTVDI